MSVECDHQLPRVAVGLPPDWPERLQTARAVVAEGSGSRQALAEAWLAIVELAAGGAALEQRHVSPAAESGLRSLAMLVGDDVDAGLRTMLAQALLAIGRFRRLAAPSHAKVQAEVMAIEAALVVGERAPPVDGIIATCLSALVKTGLFQPEAAIRERAFEAGAELRERFGRTRSSSLAPVVADGLDAWVKMLPRGDSTRAELVAERDALLARP